MENKKNAVEILLNEIHNEICTIENMCENMQEKGNSENEIKKHIEKLEKLKENYFKTTYNIFINK